MLFAPTRDHIGSNSPTQTIITAWYKNWELYPILLFATFLHFYKVGTGEFDFDQGLIYRLAYDAVHHGLWPVTNSTASLGFANAPGELYLVMIPAAFSSNPIYGVYIVSLLASLSVLITYIFTTRYYGRLAGAIATILYTTATIPLYYSRFLWQPNMMYPFVILFIFMLFIGAVEKRKGWFGPAIILLGILYQTHGITLTLLVPLGLALCMAFKTVRWCDLLYGIAGLLVIFFPFILWQISSHFSDLQIILSQTAQPSVTTNDSWVMFRLMISPYNVQYPPTDPHSLGRALMPFTSHLYNIMCYLVCAGGIIALVSAFTQWWQQQRTPQNTSSTEQAQNTHPQHWWNKIRGLPPEACGLILLCAWQITPIVSTIKHSSGIYPQYMLVLLPGPFILVSYIMVALGKRVQITPTSLWKWLRAAIGIMLAVVILLEVVNSVAILRDQTRGYFAAVKSRLYYNDLDSLQSTLNDAQRLAQQHHLKRIFIGVDKTTEGMMFYFSEHMQYPTSVFFINQCMLLPSPTDGPAILIMPPYAGTGDKMAVAHGARLLEHALHRGGDPFNIYELPPAQQNLFPITDQNTFAQDLQSTGAGYQQYTQTSLFTSWSLLHSYPLSASTTYTYNFTVLPSGNQQQLKKSACTFNMAHAGDQLLPVFALSSKQPAPTTVSVKVETYTTTPDWPILGPFHLETHRLFASQPLQLRTPTGQTSLTVSVTRT